MTELEKVLAEIEALEKARANKRAKHVTILVLHEPATVMSGRPELTPRERISRWQRAELAQRLFNFVVENGEPTRDNIEFHYRFTR